MYTLVPEARVTSAGYLPQPNAKLFAQHEAQYYMVPTLCPFFEESGKVAPKPLEGAT